MDLIKVIQLFFVEFFSYQKLNRVIEPMISDGESQVSTYDRANETSFVLIYAVALQLLRKIAPNKVMTRAIDLCCGPGICSEKINHLFSIEEYHCVDLSAPMLEKAKERFVGQGKSNVNFHQSDIRNLGQFKDHSFQLTTLMDALHHLPAGEDVTSALKECERITEPSGTIFISDLTRPQSDKLLNLAVETGYPPKFCVSHPSLVKDYHNSLRAAWTEEELCQLIPSASQRTWVLLSPFHMRIYQFLIALPQNEAQLQFKFPGLSIKQIYGIVGFRYFFWFVVFYLSYRFSKKTVITKKGS